MSADEWAVWAAYNLACGSPEGDVRDELVKGGMSRDEAGALLASLDGHPAFVAARRLGRKLRLASDLSEALIQLEGQVFDFGAIRRVAGLDAREFHRDHYAANRPVIVTDVVSRWPAMNKWDLAYLRERFGGETVTYQYGRSAEDHRDSFVDHTVQGPLSEFIDLVENAPEGMSPPYLIAHDRILDRPSFKPLLEDVVFDERYFDGADTHGRVFFWLGPEGAATPMHRDLGNVYMAQIMGRKLIRMVPAKEMHLVYNESGYHSEADFDDLALDDFPLLRDAHVMEFVLEPGDLLFIPVGWWHFVKSLDTTITVTGNNFAFPNALRPIFD